MGAEMIEIKKVMVCVDLSDYTILTVEHALALIKDLDAELLLFNVIDSKDLDVMRIASPYLPGGISVESYVEQAKVDRHKKIQHMFVEFFPDDRHKMTIKISVGRPYEAILKAVESENVDAVVLANKGKSNLVGTLHGSNGEKVFRHSPVPVFSARSRERFTRNQKNRNKEA
ncbi:MAG: nucleotide-binding universal stress UspA family protein [Desulforhopalus sp.]|jgi:nucleotide-binding universal stress UspA family protein